MKNKKFYPWLVVALLWVVALLNYMDRQMLSTMQAAMKVWRFDGSLPLDLWYCESICRYRSR